MHSYLRLSRAHTHPLSLSLSRSLCLCMYAGVRTWHHIEIVSPSRPLIKFKKFFAPQGWHRPVFYNPAFYLAKSPILCTCLYICMYIYIYIYRTADVPPPRRVAHDEVRWSHGAWRERLQRIVLRHLALHAPRQRKRTPEWDRGQGHEIMARVHVDKGGGWLVRRGKGLESVAHRVPTQKRS